MSNSSLDGILMLVADDLGWGDLEARGHPFLKTPNLDRLARSGLRVEQFYVLSPVCSPSRAAALTGQYPGRWCLHTAVMTPQRNEVMGTADQLDPAAPSLARLLQASGWHTAHCTRHAFELAARVNITDAFGVDCR